MNILPLKGLDNIYFGTLNTEIEKTLGTPDSIDNLGGVDVTGSEVWHYSSLGLELDFDIDAKFRLWSIHATSPNIYLFDIAPIGLTYEELISAFPNIVLDVSDREFKEYSLPEHGVEFFLKNDIVKRIDVHPDLNAYMNEFPDKIN